jgi:hypothetical protein
MIKFDLSSMLGQVTSKKHNEGNFNCIFCGSENTFLNERCSNCNCDLEFTKKINFNKKHYFKKAFELYQQGMLVGALKLASIYNELHDDAEGYKLLIILLFKLNDKKTANEIFSTFKEKYPLSNFIFEFEELLEGKLNDSNIKFSSTISEKIEIDFNFKELVIMKHKSDTEKMIFSMKNIINNYYEIVKRSNNKFFIENFEKNVNNFIAPTGLRVRSYLYQTISESDKLNVSIKNIIYKNRFENNHVYEQLAIELRFNELIVQPAVISINLSSKESK